MCSPQVEDKIYNTQKERHKLSAHLQSAREEERSQIANELHDTVGQALTALKMDLLVLENYLPQDQEKIVEKLHSMNLLLDHTIQAIRKIYSELRPPLLEFSDLKSAIEDHFNKFQDQTGIKGDLKINTEGIELKKSQSSALFQILQEALNNVRWHSQATHVKLELKNNSKHVNLVVKDNGIGINMEKLLDSTSFGLTGMKERANFLRGKLEIEAIPKKGTTVKINFPV